MQNPNYTMGDVLKGCPFCGDSPDVEKWHGGGPQKHMVHCGNEACEVQPGVTGATKAKAVGKWNARPDPGCYGKPCRYPKCGCHGNVA
jgi:hypothetical protein